MYTRDKQHHDPNNLFEKFASSDTRNYQKYQDLTDDEKNSVFTAKTTIHKFGTAGIRKKVGIGPNKLNDITIIQITNGLLNFAETKFGNLIKQTRPVVIGFDARYDSEYWSLLVSECCKFKGLKNIIRIEKIVPTPFVSFSVREYNALFGVMITASHNPKNDNGYKIYWENGAHIMGEIESGISEEIKTEVRKFNFETIQIPEIEKKSENFYYDRIVGLYLNKIKARFGDDASKKTLPIVYSAFHGVGNEVMMKTFETLNFINVKSVPEQSEPDPDFPTVSLPNPEDGEKVLKCSFDFADLNGSNLILANDPDADRLAVAEKNVKTGTWRVFTGNETAAIVGYWALNQIVNKIGTGNLQNCAMFGSMVSSHILKSMAEFHGFKYFETLPGFKHTGNLAAKLKREENTEILLGFEDSIGFMYGDLVLDKDGISAAIIVAQIADFYQKPVNGSKNLEQVLDEIYQTYGYHINRNSYFFSHDAGMTEQLFMDISEKFQEHKTCKIGDFFIKRYRDIRKRYDSECSETQFVNSGFFVIFDFENGASLILRTSGTEPKIKYYTEMIGEDSIIVQKELDYLVEVMIKEVIQPEKYGFQNKL